MMVSRPALLCSADERADGSSYREPPREEEAEVADGRSLRSEDAAGDEPADGSTLRDPDPAPDEPADGSSLRDD